jgi:hypothetical protein
MQARARSAGGDLELTSKPGEGLKIEVWAPRGEAGENNLPAVTAPGITPTGIKL